MSAAEIQLRTATFGGFQKQDVLNYIETANQEYLERVDSLKRELDEAVRARAGLEEQRSAGEERETLLNRRIEGLQKEAAEADQAMEALKGELSAAQERLAETESRLTEVQTLLEQTQAQLTEARTQGQQWQTAAQAYERLKDRTAGIELEAHHRAQRIQMDAETKAAAIRGETGKWLQKVQGSHNQMRADLARTVARTNADLERMRRALEELDSEFARQNETFTGMIRAYQAEEKPGAPEPLPLDGEE